MIQVCRWGPKTLTSIGAGGGRLPILANLGHTRPKSYRAPGVCRIGDLGMKLTRSVTPALCRHLQMCFKSTRYQVHRGVPIFFVHFINSYIEDIPVVQHCSTPHRH